MGRRTVLLSTDKTRTSWSEKMQRLEMDHELVISEAFV
jgi:hypothetical protein